jgi:chromosome segregation ATPase
MIMEQLPEDLRGMETPAAKEYIIRHMAALKLTEKKQEELSREYEKWASRIELAQSKGAQDLALEAQREADRLRVEQDGIEAEIRDLKDQIQRMRNQLPGLAARERSIDPDLLEQELLIDLGYMPGEESKPEIERPYQALETDAALESLKAKMKQDGLP